MNTDRLNSRGIKNGEDLFIKQGGNGALVQLLDVLEPREDDWLGGFTQFAAEEDLVDDHVHLVEVEDEVQLAHVLKEAVQALDKQVDGLKVRKLVVRRVTANGKVETRIAAVDNLVVAELHKVRELGITRRDDAVHFRAQLLLLLLVIVHIPFGQTRLACAVLQ